MTVNLRPFLSIDFILNNFSNKAGKSFTDQKIRLRSSGVILGSKFNIFSAAL